MLGARLRWATSLIPMIVVCWSCSDTPVAHPTAPTPPAATQISALAALVSAQITPSIDKMRVGETLTFSAELKFGDEGVPPSGGFPRWSSTNAAVIVVDHTGKATAVGEGNATIEVATHGHKVTRSIQVTS
jgi:uncharacterized protein YjdB